MVSKVCDDPMDLGPFLQNYVLRNPFHEMASAFQPNPNENRIIGSNALKRCMRRKTTRPTALGALLSNQSLEIQSYQLDGLPHNVSSKETDPLENCNTSISNDNQESHLLKQIQTWLKDNYVPSFHNLSVSNQSLLNKARDSFGNVNSIMLSRLVTTTFPGCSKIKKRTGIFYHGMTARQPDRFMSKCTRSRFDNRRILDRKCKRRCLPENRSTVHKHPYRREVQLDDDSIDFELMLQEGQESNHSVSDRTDINGCVQSETPNHNDVELPIKVEPLLSEDYHRVINSDPAEVPSSSLNQNWMIDTESIKSESVGETTDFSHSQSSHADKFKTTFTSELDEQIIQMKCSLDEHERANVQLQSELQNMKDENLTLQEELNSRNLHLAQLADEFFKLNNQFKQLAHHFQLILGESKINAAGTNEVSETN